MEVEDELKTGILDCASNKDLFLDGKYAAQATSEHWLQDVCILFEDAFFQDWSFTHPGKSKVKQYAREGSVDVHGNLVTLVHEFHI